MYNLMCVIEQWRYLYDSAKSFGRIEHFFLLDSATGQIINFFCWIRPLAESYNFKILYSAINFFFGHLFLNMIRPKNKIYDSAKRISCLAMLMEKTGKLKKWNMRFGQKN